MIWPLQVDFSTLHWHVGRKYMAILVYPNHISGCLQVAWVRRKGAGRALPRAHLQADLDIATLPGSSPSETLLADAEVIRAVSEVHSAPATTH